MFEFEFSPQNHKLKPFCECNFLLAICLRQERTAMNVMNEKTAESDECKRQRRLQKQREQRRTRLACDKKEQRQRRLQF